MADLGLAIHLAAKGHEGQFDKSGRPYILHPMNVMGQVIHLGDVYATVAIMHDLTEDTEMTLGRLIDYGFSTEIIDALSLLHHAKGVSYDAYIKAIATNKIAIIVKIADLTHNMNLTRLKGITDKDFKRMEKYTRSYVFLTEALTKF